MTRNTIAIIIAVLLAPNCAVDGISVAPYNGTPILTVCEESCKVSLNRCLPFEIDCAEICNDEVNKFTDSTQCRAEIAQMFHCLATLPCEYRLGSEAFWQCRETFIEAHTCDLRNTEEMRK